MARSMMKEKHLSNEFQGQEIVCSVYDFNRYPTKSVKNNVPQDAWIGMYFYVRHFKVFGFVAYAHVAKELRKNLDDRNEKCTFASSSDQYKAYKQYNIIKKQLIVRKYV